MYEGIHCKLYGVVMGEIIYEEKEKKLRQDSQSEEAPLYGCFFVLYNIVRELEKYRYCI
ncbi:hypothetical protein [Tenacibaculum maritimum]|uniref:hypothetical protein n=1 Tax=Tenacibaculum maritimum TaxID=107401 RepID=UPI0012FFEF7D|nr:hypothetical protein [Tenacibaculum maritimum]